MDKFDNNAFKSDEAFICVALGLEPDTLARVEYRVMRLFGDTPPDYQNSFAQL